MGNNINYFESLTQRGITNTNDLNIDIKFPSLHKFYTECDIIDYKLQDGAYTWEELDQEVDEEWVGLNRTQIINSKYNYLEGLKELQQLKEDIFLGGTKRMYKWDEFDGDDMNYDRYIEGFPAMQKRYRSHGSNSGNFVKIHVSIGENYCVGFSEMLNRSYAVMRLIDYLENMNYRITVVVYFEVLQAISYRGVIDTKLRIEIPIKLEQEPIIKGQILTCISPWMLRYHIFKLMAAKFKTLYGLGTPIYVKYKDSLTDIYFNSGECLNEDECNKKIKKIMKLYKGQFVIKKGQTGK